ncbi:hypothetical protein GBF38_014924 [Nibea albiflora]|uniref:Uncharacterized protein n=1 Tax=Nibea albiflora TaxID=240163 RepID=A0ACB7EJU7_NIBAL|nr:hypothetical protein GBF38_014924 [Nibea albiflora]
MYTHISEPDESSVSCLSPSARCTHPIGHKAPAMVGDDSDWSLWPSLQPNEGNDWLTCPFLSSRLVDASPPGCFDDRPSGADAVTMGVIQISSIWTECV